MSLFFLNIQKTFLNQTKNDFDLIKGEKAHYKDKFFCFESKDSKKNCFISDDLTKNFDFFVSIRKTYYLKEWKRNNFSIPSFGIKKEDFAPNETYKYIKELYSKIKDDIYNIDENEWINNWEGLLKKIEYQKLREEIFIHFWLRKIFLSFKDKSELIKEYEKVFEVHSLSECIRKNMKYKIFVKENNKFDIIEKDFKDLKIFRNKIDCSNISQGGLGTCYFLEALSILSNHGQLLYQLFPEEDINEEGIYEICLYHQEEWYKILIDDYFVFYKREDENSPLEFYFTQPAKECLYSCFLEKAYAKINGSYCDIDGGHPTMALTALTGFDSLSFVPNRINKELIKQMKVFMNKGFLLSGGALNHEYSIIRAQDDYFVVRNPWSRLRYNDKKMEKRYDRIKKLRFDLKNNEGEFKLRDNSLKQFFNLGISLCICLFGARVYKIKLNKIGIVKNNKKLYFSFETFGKLTLVFSLQNKFANVEDKVFPSNDKYSVKLELISDENNENRIKNLITFNDFKKRALEEAPTFNDFNLENHIEKGKYLGIITFEENYTFDNKVLTIIIDKNININFLGYLDKKPDIKDDNILNKNSKEIDAINYFYGENSAELKKKYENLEKLMKYIGYEIPEDCKGVYIETIFTNEIEVIRVIAKNKKFKRCFTFDKKLNKFKYEFIDENGKVTEENYTFEEINNIKIHEYQKSEREPDISFEKFETERVIEKCNIYGNKFESDLNNAKELLYEYDNCCCFSNNINYYIKLNDSELRFYLKDIINNKCCGENEIIKITLKTDLNESNYASLQKTGNYNFGEFYVNMNVIFEKEKNIKRFKICRIKPNDKILIEIYDNDNLIIKINEKSFDSNELYEIKDVNNGDIGTIIKINNKDCFKCPKILYKIKFVENRRIDFKLKILIIFAGILAFNYD